MVFLNELISDLDSYEITDIMIGVFTTLVASKNGGLASTLHNNCCNGKGIKNSGNIIGSDVRSIARLSFSENLLEASIGLAAINSALNINKSKLRYLNAKELIVKHGRGKTVGVIGHFPFLKNVKHEFKKLFIFEKNLQAGDYKEADIPEHLPNADVIAITGTAITNHTFKNILKHRKKNNFTIVLGPTTPLSPILFDYGIDAVSGALVNDINSVYTGIKEAVHFRHLKGVDYVTLLKEGNA